MPKAFYGLPGSVLTTALLGRLISQFIDEDTRALGGKVTFPRSHAGEVESHCTVSVEIGS